jgi:uncharacterized FlaG/YvyC family protein
MYSKPKRRNTVKVKTAKKTKKLMEVSKSVKQRINIPLHDVLGNLQHLQPTQKKG